MQTYWGNYVGGVKPHRFQRVSMAGMPLCDGSRRPWLPLRQPVAGNRLRFHRLLIMNARKRFLRPGNRIGGRALAAETDRAALDRQWNLLSTPGYWGSKRY